MVQPVVYENGTHRIGSMSELISISSQDGNMLSFGQDGGLFIDGNAILSNGETSNLLVISAIDKKIYLSEDNLVKAGFTKGGAAQLSNVAGNLLQVDSEGKFLLTADNIKSQNFITSSELQTATSNFVTSSELQQALANVSADNLRSKSDDNLITISQNDGKLQVTKQALLDQGFALTNSEGLDVSNLAQAISDDADNAIKLGTDNLLFVPTDMGVL